MKSKDLYKEYRERIKEAHKHSNKRLLETYIKHILKQIKKDKWTYRKNDNNMHILVQLEEHLREIKVTNKKNQERENIENAIVIDISGSAATEQHSINDIDNIEQEPLDIDQLTTNQSLYEDNEHSSKPIAHTHGKGARGVVREDTIEGGRLGQRDVIDIPVTFPQHDPLSKIDPVTFPLPEKKLQPDDLTKNTNTSNKFAYKGEQRQYENPNTTTFPLPEKKFQIDPGEDHYKNFLTMTQKTDIRDLIKELKEFRRGL